MLAVMAKLSAVLKHKRTPTATYMQAKQALSKTVENRALFQTTNLIWQLKAKCFHEQMK